MMVTIFCKIIHRSTTFNSIQFNSIPTDTCTPQLIKYRVGAHDEQIKYPVGVRKKVGFQFRSVELLCLRIIYLRWKTQTRCVGGQKSNIHPSMAMDEETMERIVCGRTSIHGRWLHFPCLQIPWLGIIICTCMELVHIPSIIIIEQDSFENFDWNQSPVEIAACLFGLTSSDNV